MNSLAKILVYAAAVVLIGALLSPPIFWACNALVEAGYLEFLRGFPFHRYFSRVTQIAALVLAWPAIRWLDIHGLQELGLRRNPARWKDLAAGLVAAMVPLAVFACGYVAFDIYRLRDNFEAAKLLRIVGTAFGVAFFEEWLFRGLLLGLALQAMRRWKAIFLVSAVFAGIHFIKPSKEGGAAEVSWAGGFEMIGKALEGLPSWPVLTGGLVTLFLIGTLLGFVTTKTHSLWLAIGLHAGWIFGQQALNGLARFRIKPPESLLPWIGPNVVSGMVPTGVIPLVALLVTCAAVWLYLERARAPHAPRGAGDGA